MIRQRGKQWQVDVQHDGKRYRKSVTSYEMAVQVEERALERMTQGLDPNPPRDELGPVTLRRLVEHVFTRHWEGTRNARMARLNAEAAITFFGEGIHPKAITALLIDDYIVHLKAKGNAPSTINRKLASLGKLLRCAFQREWIGKMPEIGRMAEPTGRIRWFTDVEIAWVLGYLGATDRGDFSDLVVFLLDSGARAGEATRLRWEDVDLAGGVVRLWETKNDRPRSIPLTERLAGALRSRQAMLLGKGGVDLVFPGWVNAQGRSTPISDQWVKTVNHLKIEGRLHDLRHTFASRLVQRGASIQAVQQLLGHSNIQMTMRYAHLAPDNLRSAVDLLEPRHNQRTGSASMSG